MVPKAETIGRAPSPKPELLGVPVPKTDHQFDRFRGPLVPYYYSGLPGIHWDVIWIFQTRPVWDCHIMTPETRQGQGQGFFIAGSMGWHTGRHRWQSQTGRVWDVDQGSAEDDHLQIDHLIKGPGK